ncbi:hypothetical protein Esi_0043_0015 [Ectocarpus siliculosus]|uniref:Uncharacterized protein n=1 Tax=Ectocarpus siliculosus TaxID=2880 RepID=D8LN32_ECTSI|nr:hypothetical protein Esi_0043_0015 [Ectocarpus siliculosus]|eukprot:CBN74795.1 hypothetical protein Esi_0043_0015 [Ectocarpus siliculosus]
MSHERVVEAVLWVIFAATLLKTVLVANALWSVASESGKKAVAAPGGQRSGQASSSGAGDQADRNTSLRPPPLGRQRAGGDRRTLPSKLSWRSAFFTAPRTTAVESMPGCRMSGKLVQSLGDDSVVVVAMFLRVPTGC